MGVWSKLVSGFSKLFKGGSTSTATMSSEWMANGVKHINTVTKVAGDAAKAGWTSMITWGNTLKVAVAGGLVYIFATGGLSKTIAGTLGISETAAQVLVWFGAAIVMLLLIRYIVNWAKKKFGLKQEYFDEPLVNRRDDSWYQDRRR